MAKQHNNFKKDIDMLSEAYNSIHNTKEEVLSESSDAPNPIEDEGTPAYKGGNVEHD